MREVRSEDPSLSPEANRLLTEELRRAVGRDRVEVPEETLERSLMTELVEDFAGETRARGTTEVVSTGREEEQAAGARRHRDGTGADARH